MNTTYFLRRLQEQDKLPELLSELDLPHEEVKTLNHECHFHFRPDKLQIINWKISQATNVKRTDYYELNDYMFLAGVKDRDQKRLQKLFDFMVKNFGNEYRRAGKQYLEELRKARLEEIEAKVAPEKAKVNDEFNMRVNLLKGNNKE